MKHSICIFLFLLILSACSEEDKPDIKRNIQVEVFCKLESSQHEYPDSGAKVFIYYDKSSIDFHFTTYAADGRFVKEDGSVIDPDQTAITDDTGMTVITPTYYDKMFTIVIESGLYSPQLQHAVYPSIKESFTVKRTFEVQKD